MFEAEVNKFLAEATWLTDADGVWTVALRACAQELDTNGVQSALISQYRQILTLLEKRKPAVPAPKDPVQAAIDAARGQE